MISQIHCFISNYHLWLCTSFPWLLHLVAGEPPPHNLSDQTLAKRNKVHTQIIIFIIR